MTDVSQFLDWENLLINELFGDINFFIIGVIVLLLWLMLSENIPLRGVFILIILFVSVVTLITGVNWVGWIAVLTIVGLQFFGALYHKISGR